MHDILKPTNASAEAATGDEIDEAVLARLQDIRTGFIKQMDWPLEGNLDQDDYDRDPRTTHYHVRQGDDVVVTMRLTEAVEPANMKSAQMMAGHPKMQREIKERIEAMTRQSDMKVYDLTRLVFSDDAPGRVKFKAMMEMFVLAMQRTTAGADNPKDVVWMFATTPEYLDFLNDAGVIGEQLAEGKVSEGDNYKTKFCMIRPAEAYETLNVSPDPRHQLAKRIVAATIDRPGPD